MAFQIYRGSDFRSALTWTDETGAAIPATGASISAILKKRLYHDEIGPITIAWTNDALGEAEIEMSEADTAVVPRGMLTYIEVTIQTAGGDTTIFTGGDVVGY